MAPLPPNIPTSFVPKQPVQAPKRKVSTGNNIFLLVSLAIAGASLVAAGGIFAYGAFLSHVETARAAELQKAQDAVSDQTVKDYIHLQQRIASSQQLLDNHIYLSRFFDDLEQVTLQNVQFKTLNITVAGDGTAKVDMDGTAKNLNALAVEDNAIASDKNFKQGIFSGIGFGDKGQINFKLTADLDTDLIHITKKNADNAPAAIQPLPAPTTARATTTATTTP